MTKVVPLKIHHLESLNKSNRLLPREALNPKVFGEMAVHDLSFALVEDGEVLGAAGAFVIWDGVAELWASISMDLRKRPMLLHKTVVKYIDVIQKKGNFHRLQFIVLRGFIEAESWAQALGFMHEGVLHNYGPGKETYRRYAKVFLNG